MYQFIETMLVEHDRIVNLPLHNQRLNQTLNHFSAGHTNWSIEKIVYPKIDEFKTLHPKQILHAYKARLLYDADHVIDLRLEPYSMRRVHSLMCVVAGAIDYSFKYADRTALNHLFAQREGADDILIVRDGHITDTSIANVALWDGHDWYTPQRPLLKGTRRESLLGQGVIRECDIQVADLNQFQKIRLFNAMIDWGKIELAMSDVHVR